MAAMSEDELVQRRDELVRQVREYRDQLSEGMNEVIEALGKSEFARACSIMSTLSQHQGQAAVDMRKVLVKYGFIVRERQDG